MSKVPHLLKGSALPDGEQRRLAEYASAHPKSALHRKGKHHDAAVLLVHGIGYQNHGETLAYFGKPVAHSVQTLLALNTDSAALSEENPAEEASARVRVEVIPDGDTLPPAAEVNPLSHHSELTYSLTIERTEYPANPVEESPEIEENPAQEETASSSAAEERTLLEQNLLERTLDSARKYRLRKWAVLRPAFDVSVLGLPVFEGAPAEELPAPEGTGFNLSSFELPKVELPKVELPKVELPKIDLPKIELPKVELPNIELPNIELPNLEFPRLPQPKPRPVRTVTRRSLLFQEGFWRPRHYRPLKEHLPWLASVLPLFLMFCFYYERPGVTWRERAGHLLRSTARFMNVALWLVLAAMTVMTFRDAFVASLGTAQGAFTGLAAVLGLGIVGWVLTRRARELWVLVKAIPTQLIQTATSPESRDLERIYERLDRQLDDLSSRSDAVGIIAHSQGGYLGYELLRRRAAAGKKPIRFFYGLGSGVVPISIIASDRNDIPGHLDAAGGYRNRAMLLWVSVVAAFSWLVEASLLFGPYRSLLHHAMLVPLALSVVPLVASVPGAFNGRARIGRKSERESASADTSATTSVNTLEDVRLVNPYGTRAYVKWLIPLLFVHGVFMLYAVFMLLLAQLRVEGAVPELTAASVAFWGALILVLMMSVRSACHLYVRAYAPMLQGLDVADRCEISARGDSIGRSNITQPAGVDVSFVTLPGPSVNSHMQYFDACSPVPLMLSHRLVPHMMPAGEQAQKAADFTDIGTELNRGFARVKKLMRTMHYGLYAVLLLMLSVLLNVASPVSLSALTGLDTSHLHSEGFDRLAADAQQLREQAGSSDLLLWVLVGIFVVEALLMMVLSPWTQRRLQRAFMMRKVDRTGQLSEFNPLPMVTALLGLDGDEDDDEDEAVASAGEKGASQTYASQASAAQANGV
ncbi:aconitase [uncultured Rothia sp.]|uniref:aconitase n=1 Tax=uncultured Rothia sp. TaxID=316088 RepID=UPI002888FA2D|nr:aconitase [uncultured Rothia sp.]